MRKAQKKQAEDFVELLGQSHEEIRKAIKQQNIPTALSLLADCQEGAISLGNLVEKTEGENAPMIPLLEEYCERLYRIYRKLSGENQTEENEIGTNQVGAKQAGGISVNADKIHKQLRQLFIRMKNGIRDIKVRREAVFLPYKASMWDSMESVWKAAQEDPDCDAYVIPIPYYDRKPGGSFGELHYEGSQYPEYVPVTWYEDYDFESRKPDMIFIHNPYDECNLVTSVLPFFYSANLKQFTEKLIYIPYFVLEEIDPDNGPAVENMKHFCLSPGVYNADKVIVQSENMRQVYIKVMTEATGKETRAYWEQKILGLGSPKFDKVLNTRKEDLKIPEEWLRIIQKPDGSWKKIIFYNTSVGALLKHSEQYLAKMRDVFRIFYENRDEVVLLWRPHPLIKATIESMRPQLWAKYKEIVTKYQSDGWGIYDDSADMDRAVALSDAYYGDGSSVLQIYQKTEKPIMLQTVHSTQENNTRIAFSNIVKYKEEWWFFSAKNNLICKMDKESLKVVPVAMVPFEWKIVEYRDMYIYDNRVFLIPFSTSQVTVYDILNDEFRKISVTIENKWRGNPFSEGILIGNRLYLLPQALNKLIYIDIGDESTHEVIGSIDGKSDISDIYFSGGCINTRTCELLIGKLLINEFVSVNLLNSKKKTYVTDNVVLDGWGDIKESQNGIWYTPYTVDCIFFEKRNQQGVYEFSNFPDGYVAEKYSFIKTFVHKDKLFLIPRSSNAMLVVDEKGNMYAPIGIEEEWDENSYYEKTMRYSDIWEDDGRLYIFSSIRGQVIELTDCEKPVYRNVDFSLLDNWCIEKDMTFTYGEEKESNFGNISFFIRHILNETANISLNTNAQKAAGIKIFHECRLDAGG